MNKNQPKLLKNILLSIFVILSGTFLFLERRAIFTSAQVVFQSPCERPIQYRIGAIDSQFNITESEFAMIVEESAEIWNQAVNKRLFHKSETGSLKINLIYDERQASLDKVNSLQDDILHGKFTLEEKIAHYDSLVSTFKSKLLRFNTEVEYWNERGGAPEIIYSDLLEQQDTLNSEAESLNALAKNLNLSVRQYNIDIGQLNEAVAGYNEDLSQKPEEGIYIPSENTINIYINADRAELIHTVTHELGHALGLDHSNDPNAIMYPYTSIIGSVSESDRIGIISVCEHGSIYEKIKNSIKRYISPRE